jgi:serpin B
MVFPAAAFSAGGGHWADSAFSALTEAGILQPEEFSSEEYDAPITRGRFTHVFMRLFDAEPANAGKGFTDVPAESAYFAAASQAETAGLITGYPDGAFRPEAPILRQEMFVIIGRTYEKGLLQPPAIVNTSYSAFSDSGAIAAYAVPFTDMLARYGIVKGYEDDRIQPLKDISCAEAISLLNRIHDAAGTGDNIGNNTNAGNNGTGQAIGLAYEDKLFAHMPETGNIVFSPFSLKIALAMAANAAEPATKQEILDLLDIADLNAYNASAQRYTASVSEHLNVANSIWINTDKFDGNVDFSASFKALVKTFYSGNAGTVNETTGADVINGWISGKTNEKIQNVLTKDDVERTFSFLVNAVHFKNAWAAPFDPAATRPDTFTDRNGVARTTDFMRQTGYYRYYEDDDGAVVKLYFKGEKQSMIFALPKEGGRTASLRAVVEKLEKAPDATYVALEIPKFEFAYAPPELKDTFAELGVRRAFDKENNGFSAMYSEPLSPTWIESILHKAYIKIDENGAEAAAATIIGGGAGGGGAAPPPKPFRVDRPFTFLIDDEENGQILFAGVYAYVTDSPA